MSAGDQVTLKAGEQVAGGDMQKGCDIGGIKMPPSKDKDIEVVCKFKNNHENRMWVAGLDTSRGGALCGFEADEQMEISETPSGDGEED